MGRKPETGGAFRVGKSGTEVSGPAGVGKHQAAFSVGEDDVAQTDGKDKSYASDTGRLIVISPVNGSHAVRSVECPVGPQATEPGSTPDQTE